MAATITTDTTPVTYSVAQVKTWLEDIGLGANELTKDAASELIYKITSGTGTYADTYFKIVFSNYSTVQAGTGYDATNEVITGAGTASTFLYSATPPSVYATRIKTSDNTFGQLIVYQYNTNTPWFTLGYVKPTNTSLTAATIPLTIPLANYYSGTNPASNRVGSYQYESPDNTGAVLNISAFTCGYIETATRLGSKSNFQLGGSGVRTGNYSGFLYTTSYAAAFGMQFAEGGSQAIVPNVPLLSGGKVYGYNSNLALCSPHLQIGDRIIVTSGSEEYVKISADGVAVREI